MTEWKESEKIDKYLEVTMMPVEIGTLGMVSKILEESRGTED